jgi:4-hydroxy-tetrahydrodipicolinate synthase
MTMKIEGVYVPVVTPFDTKGEIHYDNLTKVIERCLDAGVAGIVSCGTTGEYYAMSVEERVKVMQHTATVANGRAQLVAGCNAGSTRDAIGFGVVARDAGYDSVMLAAPPTSLPQQHELAAHFAAIAEGSGLPVILYNYPARAGVEIGMECLDLLADRADIIAIKESSSDFSRFLALRSRYEGRITIMCGSDDQAADYFFWGVRSWLAGTANVLPAEHVAVMNAALAGDQYKARDLFDKILPWVQEMESGSYNQKAKLGIGHFGIECGSVRQPLLPVDPAVAANYLQILKQVGAN